MFIFSDYDEDMIFENDTSTDGMKLTMEDYNQEIEIAGTSGQQEVKKHRGGVAVKYRQERAMLYRLLELSNTSPERDFFQSKINTLKLEKLATDKIRKKNKKKLIVTNKNII